MILSLPLKVGDVVDIVAPASSCPPEALQRGLDVLKNWGLVPRMPEAMIEASTFFANTDALRLKYLTQALRAKDSKAVWFIRGGSGTHRILPALFKRPKPATKKLIIGFSDATSLLVAAHRHWSWPTLHAPVLSQLGNQDFASQDVEELRQLLFGEITQSVFSQMQPMNNKARKQKAKLQGVLLGGNLTVFQSLIGVKDAPRVDGKILFFEDVGERGYRIDRTLTHLRQAGFFKGVKAVVFGSFTGGDEPQAAGQVTVVNRVHWALQNFADEIGFPVFQGLDVGHGLRNRPLLMGVKAEIKAETLRVPWTGKI